MLLTVFKHQKSTCATVLKATYPKTVAEADRRNHVPLPLSDGERPQTNATEKYKGPQLASPPLILIHFTLETI